MPEPSRSPSSVAASSSSAQAGAGAGAPPDADALFEAAPAAAYGGAVLADELVEPEPEPAAAGRKRRRRGFGPGFWLAAGWLGLVAFLAVFAGVLPFVDDPQAVDGAAARQGFSAAHWLGGDDIGRDVFSRVVYGARNSLFVGLLSAGIGLVVGGFFGLLAGYFRGRVESVIMSTTDVMLAFPALILALAIVSFMGQTLRNVTIALGILSIPALTRIVRANTLVFAQREFVLASRTLGATSRRVIFREVLPNVVPPMVSFSLIAVAVVVVAEGALSFLGLGIPAPNATFGGMINEGRNSLRNAPHIALAPSAAMFLTVLALNFVGDRLQARFNVKEGGL